MASREMKKNGPDLVRAILSTFMENVLPVGAAFCLGQAPFEQMAKAEEEEGKESRSSSGDDCFEDFVTPGRLTFGPERPKVSKSRSFSHAYPQANRREAD